MLFSTAFLIGCGGGGGGEESSLQQNMPPSIINSLFSLKIEENVTSVFTINASDPDGDSLSFSLSGTDSSLFSVNDDGAVIFNNSPDYEDPLDEDLNNIYVLTVNVSDGALSDSKNFSVSVTDVIKWFKGNTHTHTRLSFDSNTPEEDLMHWYKENGYGFVVASDHNYFSDLYYLNNLKYNNSLIVDESFVLIAGEELTALSHHMNGINISYYLKQSEIIKENFNSIFDADGLPQMNHPYASQVKAIDIINAARDIEAPLFIEVYNSNTDSTEELSQAAENLWDQILSSGIKMWAVAVDDSHTLEDGNYPPGGGFIYVDAEVLSINNVISAMNLGRLYASTGAIVDNFSHDESKYIVETPTTSKIIFIGKDGAELKEVQSNNAQYEFSGAELYVRAKIITESGMAWTQPVFVNEL